MLQLPQCIANKEFNALGRGEVRLSEAIKPQSAFFSRYSHFLPWPALRRRTQPLDKNEQAGVRRLGDLRATETDHWGLLSMYSLYSRDIRILVVEDNPGDVWLLREALRLAQFPVQLTVACDGIEASRQMHQLTEADESCPDLVLLDLNLPRRNGREVLAEIKRSVFFQDVPVVVLSSSSADEDRSKAHQLNAAGYLTKPHSLPAYVEMVRGLERFWADSVELRKTA